MIDDAKVAMKTLLNDTALVLSDLAIYRRSRDEWIVQRFI